MHTVLILQLLILVAVANGAALIAKKVFGVRWAWPLDGGAKFADGRRLFGPSKTIRGIVLALLATLLAAVLMGLGWKVGAVVAVAAMAGDLFSSFVKRRLGLAPSSMAIGLDQIPESLFPLLASRLLLPVTLIDIAVGTAIFFVAVLALSRILFKLRVRDEPY
jgi:CDP-archaeol synthase